MILIGILTWRRHEFVRDVLVPAILERTTGRFELVVSNNGASSFQMPFTPVPHRVMGGDKNLGVAGGKNRIFCWFKQNPRYEHLFLFEDDTFPIRTGWDAWYRAGHQTTGVECVTFQPVDFYQGISSHGPRGGALVHGQLHGFEVAGTTLDGMMLLSATRKAVDTIGGMHRNFESFVSQEHSEWMTRAKRAGLCPFTNCTFVDCEQWIDGIDYQEWRHGHGKQGGVLRPQGDPAASKLYGDKRYEEGRQVFFNTVKRHQIDKLYQDPCWDEATAKEAPPP